MYFHSLEGRKERESVEGGVELLGGGYEFAETEFATTLTVHDEVIDRFALRRLYSPLVGGCTFEDGPGSCACLPHDLEETSNAARAIGVLGAVLLVADRLLEDDLVPVRAEFVRHHQGEASANTRTHFASVGDDGDGAIRGDGHRTDGV